MKLLADVKWEDLRIGDKVKNIKTQTEGYIWELGTPEECPSDEENTISIDWDGGYVTYCVYHSWLTKVEHIGRPSKKVAKT